MFEMVIDNLKKTTELSLQMQQEMFKQWVSNWPGVPTPQNVFAAQAQKAQKKWAEFYEETLKKQRETLEAHFKAGMKYIEDAFRLAEAQDPAELRTKTVELWRQVFETLQKTYEAQMRDFQAVASRWTEMVTKATT